MAKPPVPGSARAIVYAALEQLGPRASSAAIIRTAVGKARGRQGRKSLEVALANGVTYGDILREGDARPFVYTLITGAPTTTGATPKAQAAQPEPQPSFTASVGMKCNRAPENRAQGTIEEALRAVLSEDAPLPLDEVLRLLPIGWSRTEAISGLKEAALDGWANYGPDGWQLVGEPPAPRAEDPASVRAIPNHMHLRLQEVDGQVREQLRDAVTLGRSPLLCAALANASAELNKALALIDA